MKWTTEEIKIVKTVYPEKGIYEAKRLLPNRSNNAIFLKASGLGIKLRPGYYSRRWAENEIELIRVLYPRGARSKLSEALPIRTYNQIKLKAQKLGIQREISRGFWDYKPVKMVETDKAYLAGIFDGEGHLLLHISKRNHNEFHPEIGITTTTIDVMRDLYNLLQANGIKATFWIDRRKNDPVRKPIAFVRVNQHASALSLLQALLPYLRIKKERARLLISFLTKKMDKKPYKQELKALGYM